MKQKNTTNQIRIQNGFGPVSNQRDMEAQDNSSQLCDVRRPDHRNPFLPFLPSAIFTRGQNIEVRALFWSSDAGAHNLKTGVSRMSSLACLGPCTFLDASPPTHLTIWKKRETFGNEGLEFYGTIPGIPSSLCYDDIPKTNATYVQLEFPFLTRQVSLGFLWPRMLFLGCFCVMMSFLPRAHHQ